VTGIEQKTVTENVIEARDLSLSFGRTPALRGASLAVLLTAAVRDRGTTVVLVTHDARVAAYADREVVVRDGRVGTLTGSQP
jgi:predicted ABC-type transport system involved in lysophospholipase L1 biosynthesis ATPase subunit